MSILTKIIFLFLMSISLMFYLSIQTNTLTNEKIELIHTQKYIQASNELFEYLISGDTVKLKKRIETLNYTITNDQSIQDSIPIYENKVSFGSIRIYKKDELYFLYMSYLDDEVLYFDQSQNEELEKKKFINYLIAIDIIVLVIMLFIILKMLFPLKIISKGITKFGAGDYSYRLEQIHSNDEISQMIRRFNTMAENLERLIMARTQFLSDISHELRTPISKSKIALEMIEDSKYKQILKKSIIQVDQLTNEILELEKLNSQYFNLDFKEYTIETIFAEVFTKMLIEDDEIELTIHDKIVCKVDLNYFAIAIKNLIDNALKYKTSGHVTIEVTKEYIEITNLGTKLSKDLEYYTRTFTQEDSSRSNCGYGLGLNIVKRILDHHGFDLLYSYEKNCNKFKIVLTNL